jgi:hypothetical protein
MNNPFTTLTLLPYSQDTVLHNKKQKMDVLCLLRSLNELSISALEQFLKGKLIKFDAQVGENLCQIRAYKILFLGNKWLKSERTIDKIKNEIVNLKSIKIKIQSILHLMNEEINSSFSYNKTLDYHEKIASFFREKNLLIDIEVDFIFIIFCYFLTYFNVRDNGIPIAIDLKKISDELKVSKHRAKRLTHHYQQLICQFGCDFIVDISKEIMPELSNEGVFSQLYKISDEDRAVLPCYLVSESIFYHSIMKNTPVLLVVNLIRPKQNITFYLLLKSHTDKERFVFAKCSDFLSSFCLIVKGVAISDLNTAEFIEKTLKNPLILILANTASHPQYSGKRLESFQEDPYAQLSTQTQTQAIVEFQLKFNKMKHIATHLGCCRENQKSFFLKHIYANNLQNELIRLSKEDDVYEASYFNQKGILEFI